MRTYSFETGAKAYTLRFDINSVCNIEEAADRTPIQVLCNQDRLGFSTLRLLIQHGLKWKDAGITKDKAGNIIQTYLAENGSIDELAKQTLLLLAESAGAKQKPEETDEEQETDEVEKPE